MKYVFFGGQESAFAQIILDGLTKAGFPPIAAFRDAKTPINLEQLKNLNADFFLVAAFGKILKKELFEIPPKGTIAAHPSLLPKYRGASPIQSAILNNEKETGAAIFLIDEKVDHGPVLANSKLQIVDSDTYETLINKLADLSVNLILKTIPKWLNGELQPQPQDENTATYTKKFTAEDAEINLNADNPEKIWLKIRALNPEPGTYAMLNLKNKKQLRLKLLKAGLKNEKLELLEVQPEGKKKMSYQAFLNGYKNLL